MKSAVIVCILTIAATCFADQTPPPTGHKSNKNNAGLTLKSVSFVSSTVDGTNNVALYKSSTDGGAETYTAVGDKISPPQWKPAVPPNTPTNYAICYVMNTTASVKLDLAAAVAANGVEIEGIDTSDNSVYFDKKNATIPKGGAQIQIDASTTLPNKITKLTKTYDWKVIDAQQNTVDLGNSGPHIIYCIYAQPVGDQTPTTKRVDWAVADVDGKNTITDAADAIHTAVSNNPGFNAPLYTDWVAWEFLDSGHSGDCATLAHLCVAGLNVMGINATALEAYPTFDGTGQGGGAPAVTPTSCSQQITKNFQGPDGNMYQAALMYMDGPWRFEGFFTVSDGGTTKAYTVFPAGGPYSSA